VQHVWVAGLVTAILGGLTALISAILKRRTESETSDEATARRLNEERTALVKEWQGLLDPYRTEVGRLSGAVETLERKLEVAQEAHEKCEKDLRTEKTAMRAVETRLRQAEARIAELGKGL
jgi:chromosome segregation ATPase